MIDPAWVIKSLWLWSLVLVLLIVAVASASWLIGVYLLGRDSDERGNPVYWSRVSWKQAARQCPRLALALMRIWWRTR